MTVGIFEAKQKLSEFVERASQGEEIVITCRGRERARLVRAAAKRRRSVKEIFDSFVQRKSTAKKKRVSNWLPRCNPRIL
jgi:prevent-host-death family protein